MLRTKVTKVTMGGVGEVPGHKPLLCGGSIMLVASDLKSNSRDPPKISGSPLP